MIITRAPLRISFVGGGTDLSDFYTRVPGKVISATIDKYVYTALNPAPLLKGISARYSENETVAIPEKLKNDRIREALLYFKVRDNMELGVFSHLPTGTGLGGSSSFTVALIKALTTYLGKRIEKKDIAKLACEVEIDILKEPIGKQDQYAASMGGFNIFTFNPDGSVDTEPLLIDYKLRLNMENHMLVFFTGITRSAKSVLGEQKKNTSLNLKQMSKMLKLVDAFHKKLLRGDIKSLGTLLHENWLIKKSLASKISNETLDNLYDTGIKNGAWGGKILGAGGGGCLLFFAPDISADKIRQELKKKAKQLNLRDFKEVPVKFVHSGVEIVSNTLYG